MENLKFDERGLIPAVVQDADNGQVLMMAWMSAESLRRSLETGETWFWSRSRGELWHKGETSGNVQKVVEIHYDCDGDVLLVRVHPAGPACHTGETSCFYRTWPPDGAQQTGAEGNGEMLDDEDFFTLARLYGIICSRRGASPEGSYTAALFAQGEAKMAQKVGEEATEMIVAALAQNRERLVAETADLVYHTLVLLAAKGITPQDVLAELERRHR